LLRHRKVYSAPPPWLRRNLESVGHQLQCSPGGERCGLRTSRTHVDKGRLSEENTGNGALRRRRGLCRCDIESAAGILDFLSESAGPADVCRKSSVSASFMWCQKLQRMPEVVSRSAILGRSYCRSAISMSGKIWYSSEFYSGDKEISQRLNK